MNLLAYMADQFGFTEAYAVVETWGLSWTIDQVLLMGFSLLAAWLVNDHRPLVRRWGPVFGLLSQPFWIYTAMENMQPGVLIMSAVYCVAWARGTYNGWFRKG